MDQVLCTVGVIAVAALALSIVLQRIPAREVLTTAAGVLLLVIIAPTALATVKAALVEIFMPSLWSFLKFSIEIAAVIAVVLLLAAALHRLLKALFGSVLRSRTGE